MEQLTKAYEAIEMLKALNLPISNEQLRGVEKLEKEYLQDEIIPLMKQELEPMVEKLKGQFLMQVNYNQETGLEMTIVKSAQDIGNHLFKHHGEKALRDTTKYSIDGGKPLRKRRFVLAVVKEYVKAHPYITYEGLRERFPDSLSGRPMYGVFRPYQTILSKLENQPDLRKRFFLDKEDLIELSDGTILTVFNQWGDYFPTFLEVAKQLHEVKCHRNQFTED